MVILSHGHYDHGGGLLRFFKINRKAKVYLKERNKARYVFLLWENKKIYRFR